MSWDNQNPQWGKKTPPTPEELIASIFKKVKESFEKPGSAGGNGSGAPPSGQEQQGRGGLLRILAIVFVLLALNSVSPFFRIGPGERGVVLRLGKYFRTAPPGLNFMIPFIDEVRKVDIEAVRKDEFGFRTKLPGQKSVFEKQGFDVESLMLTGDKNLIDLEWVVQYKVDDPVRYLFKIVEPKQAVRDISEAVVRRIVGNKDFDYVLGNRGSIESDVTRELQKTLNSYESGIAILTVKLQDVNPPDPVRPAFNEVNEADQDMKRLVNEAEEQYNQVIPKARGEAKKIVEEAEGYAVERVNNAKGEASRFAAILKEYTLAKDVTRRRMYFETMQEVLPEVKEIYVLDEAQQSVLPFLELSRAGGREAGAKK